MKSKKDQEKAKALDKIDDIDDKEDIEDTKVVEVVNDSSDFSEEVDDTKEIGSIEEIACEFSEKELNDDLSDITKYESKIKKLDKVEENKSHSKKKIVAIILVCIVVILFIILICVLNINRKNKADQEIDKDTTDIVLTEEDKKEMIAGYGEALENVIFISYQKNQVLLSFDEANKLVKLENDVVCGEHEIYEDGKVYLNGCSINGILTKYSYGEKQEPKEKFDSGTMIKVYVNKTTNEQTLVATGDLSNFDEYTVHCNGVYDSPTLLGYSNYVFYYDSDYNVQMKNFKTDKKVLEEINYIGVLPFFIDSYYDTKYIAVNIGNKWGIYDLETTKAVIAPTYDAIAINLAMGTSGPPLAVSTLKENNIAVCRNSKYGVINYTNGKEIIPVVNDTLMRSGNYLWASFNDGNDNAIYDFLGNKYLTEGYDKVYGISGGTYVLVEQDAIMKLIQLDGKVLYEYGETDEIGGLNFALEYNGGALFQFYKKDNQNSMCVEYAYNPSDKTGEMKEIECGGIAKPILYLYTKEKTNVTVSFSHPEFLETTYPKFNNYWSVNALPDGSLYDKDNKYYYALYWDEKKVHTVDFSEGFYVEKDNAIDFLEEKLSYIGLNDREKNEFIMYWLPILEKNEKNLVYFELTEERESYNKLLIDPQPDSMLRLVIHIKKVDSKVNIKKQSLTKFKRVGFTVVEWGGTTY